MPSGLSHTHPTRGLILRGFAFLRIAATTLPRSAYCCFGLEAAAHRPRPPAHARDCRFSIKAEAWAAPGFRAERGSRRPGRDACLVAEAGARRLRSTGWRSVATALSGTGSQLGTRGRPAGAQTQQLGRECCDSINHHSARETTLLAALAGRAGGLPEGSANPIVLGARIEVGEEFRA